MNLHEAFGESFLRWLLIVYFWVCYKKVREKDSWIKKGLWLFYVCPLFVCLIRNKYSSLYVRLFSKLFGAYDRDEEVNQALLSLRFCLELCKNFYFCTITGIKSSAVLCSSCSSKSHRSLEVNRNTASSKQTIAYKSCKSFHFYTITKKRKLWRIWHLL